MSSPPPPPPPPAAGDVAETWVVARADFDAAVHVSVYVIEPAVFGVIVAEPLVGLSPAQPSPDCPSVALQAVAFEEVHVSVTGLPIVIVSGDTASLTAGNVTVTVVLADASTPETPQFKP